MHALFVVSGQGRTDNARQQGGCGATFTSRPTSVSSPKTFPSPRHFSLPGLLHAYTHCRTPSQTFRLTFVTSLVISPRALHPTLSTLINCMARRLSSADGACPWILLQIVQAVNCASVPVRRASANHTCLNPHVQMILFREAQEYASSEQAISKQ